MVSRFKRHKDPKHHVSPEALISVSGKKKSLGQIQTWFRRDEKTKKLRVAK